MGRIVVTEFITLDGVAEDPGGAEGLAGGGWSFRFDRGKEGDQFNYDEVFASDAHLLGRKTYQAFSEAWPSRTGDFADRFNALPKYVVSNTLKDGEWGDTTILRGEPSAEIAKLRERHDRDILVSGSIELVRFLLATDLIDQLRLMVFPIVLGTGKRLFADHAQPSALRLVSCKPAGETVILTLQRRDDTPQGPSRGEQLERLGASDTAANG
ncbi:MAG: dihydrofolate reductase family protein [Solirubrobacterales bacterium]|nr:dihydrofolate reductase family protein [Solirubrobacterales bacterium]